MVIEADDASLVLLVSDVGTDTFIAFIGLISVVAKTKKTNNKKTRSVIDDAENDVLIFELLLIAIR
jgi:hypothetical protein